MRQITTDGVRRPGGTHAVGPARHPGGTLAAVRRGLRVPAAAGIILYLLHRTISRSNYRTGKLKFTAIDAG